MVLLHLRYRRVLITPTLDKAVPIEVNMDVLTNLEATMYFIAANLPPLRSLIGRARNGMHDFAHKHYWCQPLIGWKARPRKWLQRIQSVEESYYADPSPEDLTAPQPARLGYVSTHQVSRFGEDLRTHVDSLFDGPSR